jgi:hypothetical protein
VNNTYLLDALGMSGWIVLLDREDLDRSKHCQWMFLSMR